MDPVALVMITQDTMLRIAIKLQINLRRTPALIYFPVLEQDKSWRVRYMVANQLYELCEAVGPEPTR